MTEELEPKNTSVEDGAGTLEPPTESRLEMDEAPESESPEAVDEGEVADEEDEEGEEPEESDEAADDEESAEAE